MKYLYILLLCILFPIVPGFCAERPLADSCTPFSPGEKFTFALYWEFVPAGTAILEVLPMADLDGIRSYHFAITISTNSVLDKIFIVRDHIEAYADEEMTHSLLFRKKTEEGRRKKDGVVRFNWENPPVCRSDFRKKAKPLHIPPGTFDPLSVFYALRNHNFAEKAALEIPVADGDECTTWRARVLHTEQVTVPAGVYETFLVEPDTKDIGGIFKKSRKARLHVWLSRDSHHIPVRVSSSVAVGHFYADLISAEKN